MNEFDTKEIRGVVACVLQPSVRESYFTLNYHRAVINVELMLTLKHTKEFQAIAMLARAIMETAAEMKLMALTPDATEKISVFMELERLRAAKRVVSFKDAYPDAGAATEVYQQFISLNEGRLASEQARLWPGAKKVKHWSLRDMSDRANFLGREFNELYQLHYSQFSWYVHPGVTGIANIPPEGFAHLCGVAFRLTVECYGMILESIINEFKIYQADDKLKSKIRYAKMIPFANTPDEINAIRSVLDIR